MYFDRKDQPVLLTDYDDVTEYPGDQLAADDGSDSDDEPNSSGVVKRHVTFADAVDSTIEEANADAAATSGGTATVSAATSTATTTRSGRVSQIPVRLGGYKTNLSLLQEAFQVQSAATQPNYIAHMINLTKPSWCH